MIKKLMGLCFSLWVTCWFLAIPVSADNGSLRVGMEAGYAPFNWTQTDDSHGAVPIEGTKEFAGGYDVEIAKIVAQKLDKKLVIVKTEWDGLPPALTSGKIDAVIAGMSPNPERLEKIDFSDTYYQTKLVLVVKKDGPFAQATSLQDLSGARVTAQLNTFHYSVIEQIPGVAQQTAMDNFPAMRVALQSGKIDAYVTEKPEAVTAEVANPQLKMVEFAPEAGFQTDPTDTSIAIGLKKDSPLKAEINTILSTISTTDQEDIMNKAIANQPLSDAEPETGKSEPWVIKIVKENGLMFLRGAGTTLFISLIGTVVGTAIGMAIGLFRTVPQPKKGFKRFLFSFINKFFSVYIEIFRGTPMIVQSMVIYYGSSEAFGLDLNPIVAALFIVSINTGAYMTEIVRGGIFAVDKGQFEAAQAIGMTHFQTMKTVVVPQVIRHILPATGNEFVINIKDTSVLNVIAVSELYFQGKSVAGSNYQFFPTFFVICVIYFVMTFTVTQILRYLERRLDGPTDYAPYANQMQVQRPEDTHNTQGGTH